MTITHHPDPSTLMSYAAGSLPEPLAAVVAAHNALCPCCRKDVRALEIVGGAVLDSLAHTPVACSPPSISLDSLRHGLPARTTPPRMGEGEIPPPVARLVGSDLDKLRWRRLGPGLWHVPLPVARKGSGDLRLLRVAPGQQMPEHGHGGSELTLVLRGAYADATGCYRAGDLADLGDDVEHKPVADKTEGCVCLIASDARMRFKSLLARLIQPLTGM